MQRSLVTSNLSGFVRSRFLFTHSRFNTVCRQRHQQYPFLRNLAVPLGNRAFSGSPRLCKKKDKAKKGTAAEPETTAKSPNSGGISEDPFDLSQLQDDIAATLSRLKDDLSKLRAGGRLSTEAIEGLRVQLSKGSNDSVRLGELAQVVPKGGRMMTVFVAEEDHIKPINSSIVSSNLSLTPQPDAHNGLQINIPIPPPTKESRDKTVQSAKAAVEKAAGAVRDSRGSVHKRLQDMQKKKVARPDDVRKAQDQMEKLTEKGQKEVKDLFETSKKALERA